MMTREQLSIAESVLRDQYINHEITVELFEQCMEDIAVMRSNGGSAIKSGRR